MTGVSALRGNALAPDSRATYEARVIQEILNWPGQPLPGPRIGCSRR
jgi:hypothetical protein